MGVSLGLRLCVSLVGVTVLEQWAKYAEHSRLRSLGWAKYGHLRRFGELPLSNCASRQNFTL